MHFHYYSNLLFLNLPYPGIQKLNSWMYIFVKGSGHILRLLRLEVFIYNVYVPITSENSASEGKILSSEEHSNAGKKLSPCFFLKKANKILINPRKKWIPTWWNAKEPPPPIDKKNSVQNNNWRKYHVEEAFVLNIFNIFLEFFLYSSIVENFYRRQYCIYQLLFSPHKWDLNNIACVIV